MRSILYNEVCIGNTVHYKHRKTSFKSKQTRLTTEDEWLRVENTHEPIIPKELWDLAHAHMDSRKRMPTRDEDNIFARLLFCGECGWSFSRANVKGKSVYYRCTKYSQRGKDICSLRYTPYKLVCGLVLHRLQYWLMEVKQNETKILDRLLQSGDKQRLAERRYWEKELKKSQKRKDEVDRLFVKIYEDNASGRLDDDNYEILRAKYRTGQTSLRGKSNSTRRN